MAFVTNFSNVPVLLVMSALAILGCSPKASTTAGSNQSHIITCGRGMGVCATKATALCGNKGYTILAGVSRYKLLGGSSSSYRNLSEYAELTVLCGLPKDGGGEQQQVVDGVPERTEPAGPPSSPSTGAQNLCVPGSTGACIGPGACQGGQSCLESGRGFAPCDCGGTQAGGARDGAIFPEEPNGRVAPTTADEARGQEGASSESPAH